MRVDCRGVNKKPASAPHPVPRLLLWPWLSGIFKLGNPKMGFNHMCTLEKFIPAPSAKYSLHLMAIAGTKSIFSILLLDWAYRKIELLSKSLLNEFAITANPNVSLCCVGIAK